MTAMEPVKTKTERDDTSRFGVRENRTKEVETKPLDQDWCGWSGTPDCRGSLLIKFLEVEAFNKGGIVTNGTD